ncbi:hypothetical protein Aperf_G00000041979 [Anoplocephala perfoliata]
MRVSRRRKSGDVDITESRIKIRRSVDTSESSAVYFVLSPEWKAVVTEKEKIFLFIFSCLYFAALIAFSYALVLDVAMVHEMKIKAFKNNEVDTPIIQKVNFDAYNVFRTGIWFREAITILKPDSVRKKKIARAYPLLQEKMINSLELYEKCMNKNFRTKPVLLISRVFLILGSVIYTLAGPLVIVSRSAFYTYATIGSALLTAFILNNLLSANLLTHCLIRVQAVWVDEYGFTERLWKGKSLFEVKSAMDKAYTSTYGFHLIAFAFLPIIIMGFFSEMILGQPI